MAVLDWTHLLEDFLDHIGVSFDAFRTELTGGWLFGYVEALRTAGASAALLFVSARVDRPTRFRHEPTGSPISILPSPRTYRAARRVILNPYADSLERAVGRVHGVRRPVLEALRHVTPYLATPPIELVRELRRTRADVLLCQDYEHPRFDVAVAVGRMLGVPVFGTFQGGDFQLSSAERLVRPLALRACAGLVAASRTERERLQARYGLAEGKVAGIPNPISLDGWGVHDRDEARRSLGIPSEAHVLAWHGRVQLERKGLDVLLSAWRLLAEERRGADLRLLLVGSGHDDDRFRSLLRETGLGNVLWVDEYIRDRAELDRLLVAADVWVLPSRHEGFPVAPLEAMACGLPVVLTRVSGAADILEHGERSGGLLVPVDDAAALAAAMGRLLDDPEGAREIGQRARVRAEAFGLERVGAELSHFLVGS